jgi:hypothetical protein
MFQPTAKALTLEEAITQGNRNHFFTGVNLMALSLILCLLDVHWLMMGSGLTVFCMIQAF